MRVCYFVRPFVPPVMLVVQLTELHCKKCTFDSLVQVGVSLPPDSLLVSLSAAGGGWVNYILPTCFIQYRKPRSRLHLRCDILTLLHLLCRCVKLNI